MNKRTLLAGVLGALAMFVWTSLAHTVLPLGEAGIKQIDNEQALLSTMQSTLTAPGFYLFPKMTPGDRAQSEKLLATGPSGVLIYFPQREFSFGKLLAVEFGVELLQCLIAVTLLSLASVGSFGGRLGFYALLGLLAALATNVSYWNWYGFPTAYTLSYMFINWTAYVIAGLVAAAMKVGSPAPR